MSLWEATSSVPPCAAMEPSLMIDPADAFTPVLAATSPAVVFRSVPSAVSVTLSVETTRPEFSRSPLDERMAPSFPAISPEFARLPLRVLSVADDFAARLALEVRLAASARSAPPET
ncbi:hypothetical protein D3C87_1847110 [compost metagenome]